MSTVVEPGLHAEVQSTESDPAQRLRAETVALRLSFRWLGTRKSLSSEQRHQAAQSFQAESSFVSAGKKLLDTSHPAYKAVTSVRSMAITYWKGISVPYPEPGIRLIRRSDVSAATERLDALQVELNQAVRQLDQEFEILKASARQRLGALYCEEDYPASLIDWFAMTWDFPNVEPPDYLRRLSPELYAQECRRVRDRFSEAVSLAEQAFAEELAKLVTHLAERLGGEDGRPKVFRDSAVENLNEFFDRFQRLSVSNDETLKAVVDEAREVIRGVAPQELRDRQPLRQQVADELLRVQSRLDGLMVDRPRRSILRRPR